MIFPHKLWRLVNEKYFSSAIWWAEDGASFYIFDHQFQKLCLGKENNIFYTKNTKSFVRQLHLYGFRKINKNQFIHPHFKRDQPAMLKYIKRSYKPLNNRSNAKESPQHSRRDRRTRPSGSSSSSRSYSSNSGGGGADQENLGCSSPESILATRNNQPDNKSNTTQSAPQLSAFNGQQQVIADFCLQQVDLNLDTAFAHDIGNFGSSSQINSAVKEILGSSLNTLVVPGTFDDSCTADAAVSTTTTTTTNAVGASALPLEWYESSMVEINYNYNEDSVLTMYNNDIYPNTCDNNNITL